MKVLIVDDNSDDRKLLRLNLERHGCETVIEACDGQEGLDLARVHRPDLIISDAMMPRLDGFEFLHLVKTNEELKAIPFIFHSSVYTGMKDEELASRLGAEAFITKPKEPEEFWREIGIVLERLATGEKRSLQTAPLDHEKDYLTEYCAVVAAKLEQKVRELEESLALREKAEETLLKLSVAVEQSPVSIVITDTHGTIEFVNQKFTQITGYEREDAIGKTPRILKSGETSPEAYKDLWETLAAGNVWQGEFHNKKSNGELFWEAATISPVKNKDGDITHYIAIKEDITERRKLEEQLRHSQKMEAIGTLTGGIAHDFNNILTAIIGFSSILEMKMAEDDPLLPHVTQILTAADRATSLTRSLLAFSRKESIQTRPVDLNAIVTNIDKILRRLIREDFDLQITPANGDLTIMADSVQIEQVLLNLTSNARDAMPSGGKIIITTGKAVLDDEFIKVHGYGKPGSYAMITFTDSGAGMDEGTRHRIFEPFFTTKEVGKGTGLGLSICYGIIKQHGGYIVCESEPGRGTTFRIYLPLSQLSLPEVTAATDAPLAGGTETILMAEDDAAVRSLISSILTEFGYTVIEALDGEEALAKFVERQQEIGLCLFDVIMPNKNGRDVYEEIRKTHPDIKVLFMSGYQADFSRQGGLLPEGTELITKPVLPRELLTRVREILDR